MKIYVASSWRNKHLQQGIVAMLKSLGHNVYDFVKPSRLQPGFSWSEVDPDWKEWTHAQYKDALSHPAAQRGFDMDMEALRQCDLCVLVLPCGRSAHLELGWAAGAAKFTAILLMGEEKPEAELMYKMCDVVCSNTDELMNYVELLVKGLSWPAAEEHDQSDFKEPWTFNGADNNYFIDDRTGTVLAETIPRGYSNADERIARRIVACVNHCAAIPTHVIEGLVPSSTLLVFQDDLGKVITGAENLLQDIYAYMRGKVHCDSDEKCWCRNKRETQLMKDIDAWKVLEAQLTDVSVSLASPDPPISEGEPITFDQALSAVVSHVAPMFTQAEALAIQSATQSLQLWCEAKAVLDKATPVFSLESDKITSYQINAEQYEAWQRESRKV